MATKVQLLKNATTVSSGNAITADGGASYQATVSGTGAVSATIVINVSNDNANWITMGTITLSGTTTATDGFTSTAPWAYIQAAITAISGTGATVNVSACYDK
jgi:hypothetical protein